MFQICQGHLVVPYVPQFEAAVHGSAQEYVLNLLVEADLSDESAVARELGGEMLVGPRGFACSGVPETDDSILAAREDQVILRGVDARGHLVVGEDGLLDDE